jgi:hypothetical protein
MFRRLAILILFARFCSGQSLTPDHAINRYLTRSRDRQPECSDGAFAVQIDASLPKLKKEGSMSGVKVISRTGQAVYRGLQFSRDKLVKTAVIARFLANEAKPPDQAAGTGVTRQNYSIVYDGASPYNELRAYVFRVKPIRKRKGLFKGSYGSMRVRPLLCGCGVTSSNRRRFLSGTFASYRIISVPAIVRSPSACCSLLTPALSAQ